MLSPTSDYICTSLILPFPIPNSNLGQFAVKLSVGGCYSQQRMLHNGFVEICLAKTNFNILVIKNE